LANKKYRVGCTEWRSSILKDVDTVKRGLRQFISDSFLLGNDEIEFTDVDSFLDTGIIDSTGILELVSYLEKEFGFSVEDEEMIPSNFDTIENLVGYVARKTA
jgi:acyl carrier protein